MKYFKLIRKSQPLKPLYFYAETQAKMLHEFTTHYTGGFEDVDYFEEIEPPKDPRDIKGDRVQ
jgi:hypothetical protein